MSKDPKIVVTEETRFIVQAYLEKAQKRQEKKNSKKQSKKEKLEYSPLKSKSSNS